MCREMGRTHSGECTGEKRKHLGCKKNCDYSVSGKVEVSFVMPGIFTNNNMYRSPIWTGANCSEWVLAFSMKFATSEVAKNVFTMLVTFSPDPDLRRNSFPFPPQGGKILSLPPKHADHVNWRGVE
ncbi:hypothetical protein CDAR_446051 [Caerostris darwini]|uniref:Uncharacterized protein n=1 Tax=Caerostris darwini TaxID=1538125 RepID=A0AAV4SS37_9ARAC|nr:hypothetical protein CDAR_446051 [Caerostris darwini]